MYEQNNRMYVQEQEGQLEAQSAAYMARVMGWMCLGLLTTVVSAMLCLSVPAIFAMVFGSEFGLIAILILQLGLVIILSAAVRKLSPAVATVLFMAYAAVTGLTLSVFAIAYELGSLILAFGITAGLFLAMSLYGFFTKKDLSRMGSLLLFGLIGLIVAGLVNIFLNNPMMDLVVCCFGVLIFIGLTAYDTNKIKAIYQSAVVGGYDDEHPEVRKLAIIGALSLYLDFINLFLYLLRLLGRRRR